MKTVVKILSALLMLSAFPALAAYIEWIPTNKDNCKAYVGMEIESDHDVTGSWYGKCQGGYIEGEGDLTIFVHGEPKDISLSGTFKKGKLAGQGVVTSTNGQLQGNFVEGKLNGEGSIFQRGNFYYKGAFSNGKPNGKGEFVTSNGDRYTGEMRDGKRTGIGRMIRKIGKSLEGEFLDGKLTSIVDNRFVIMEDVFFDKKTNKKWKRCFEWFNFDGESCGGHSGGTYSQKYVKEQENSAWRLPTPGELSEIGPALNEKIIPVQGFDLDSENKYKYIWTNDITVKKESPWYYDRGDYDIIVTARIFNRATQQIELHQRKCNINCIGGRIDVSANVLLVERR